MLQTTETVKDALVNAGASPNAPIMLQFLGDTTQLPLDGEIVVDPDTHEVVVKLEMTFGEFNAIRQKDMGHRASKRQAAPDLWEDWGR
jgi:hypothetical protein